MKTIRAVKGQRMLIGVLIVGLLLTLAVGLIQAQGPQPPDEDQPADEAGVVSGIVPIQGRLTDADGSPLNGSYSVRARIYDVSTGGAPLCDDTDTVTVDNGLFNMNMNFCAASDIDGEQLYLGITVGSDPEMTPRQAIYAVPYAWSLRPGAIIRIDSSSSAYDPVLEIRSNYSSTADLDGLHVFSESMGEAIEGYSWRGKGVYGFTEADGTASDAGVYGSAANGAPGVRGHSAGENTSYSYGGYFTSANRRGLYVRGDPGGGWYDAYFAGPVGIYVVDDIAKGGVCSAAVAAGDDDVRKLYAIESPNVWFEDFGQGQLVNGQATVTIEPLFRSTINTEVPYHVFLTPLGDCNGLYVTNKTATSFEVRELGGGTANVAFDYRIVAIRKGYETVRMEPLTEGGKPMKVEPPTPSKTPKHEEP